MKNLPNILFVFADQWRYQATGYAGDPNVVTPHLDRLAGESINFSAAVSGCPVCTPYRASLLTGQRPLTHGLFVNDVPLQPKGTPLGEAFAAAGYATGWIGKWHLNGNGRSHPIPKERRMGFDYWKVLECTHDYRHSLYYCGDETTPRLWPGYDATAQTEDALAWMEAAARDPRPFFLTLSWGPPHSPYRGAPPEYEALYDPERLVLPPNVPPELEEKARRWLAGYYAHCSALDACIGALAAGLERLGMAEETVFIFTSDHGDMLGSHGQEHKQRPWEESVRVPFLLRYPGAPGWQPREVTAPIDAPDIMPTLLGLCGLPVPDGVEGLDYSPVVFGGSPPGDGVALLTCPHPFGQWSAPQFGGRAYRGIRTDRHTYVRDRNGPWLLYDNGSDPFQLRNLLEAPCPPAALAVLVERLDALLSARLEATGDRFLDGAEYVREWGYPVDETGTVPYLP